MSLFNNTNGINTVNVLGQNPSAGEGLDTLAELDAVITQLNIESPTTNSNGNIATVQYVNSLVISGGSVVGSDPVLVSAGNVSLKYDNNSLVLNTSGQLIQNINYLNPLLNVSNDVNLFGDSTNVNFRNTGGTILSTVNNSGSVLTLSSSNLVLTGQSSVANLNVSSTLFSNSISSGSVRSNTGTIGNLHANNLHAVINGTIGTLVSGSASITNIENSNSSISNLVNTNSTQTNILVTNISSSSMTVSGTSRFNNSVEVVRSGSIPSLLISGGVTGGNGATVRLVGAGQLGSSVQIDMSTYDTLTNDPTSRIRAVDEAFSSNLLFQTKVPGADTNPLATRMFIANDGKIGINTTVPSEKLYVSGNIFCTGNILSNGILDIGANSAGGTITHSIRNNAPETPFNSCRFLSIVSNTNKFSNMDSFLTTSGNVNFYLELSRTAGSSICFGIDHDRQETTFKYGLYGPLDLYQDTWDLNETKESLGGQFTAWNRLYLKGNAYIRNIYARTTGQLIGTDDTAQGYRFNILADNITSNNLILTNSTTSNSLITALSIRRNTSGWNPGLYLNPPASGNENYMIFNNIAGGPTSIGSWLLGTPSGATGGTFQIGFANTPYAFNIMTSGNIGIGTISPSNKLHVSGGNIQLSNSGTRSSLIISGGVSGGQGSKIQLIGGGGGSSSIEIDMSTYDPGANDPTSRIRVVDENFSSNLLFQTKIPGSDSNALSTRMYIRNDGNVGIGTTSPGNQLTLSTDSAAKPSTNTWTVSSDERLKINITNANLDICYDNVKNIPLKRYTWRDDIYTPEQVSDRSKLGWIAQDVEGYIPKAIQQQDMHGYSDCRSLNADQIIASLYGAVQKLMDKCEKHDEILDIITNKSPSIRKLFNT